MRGKASQRAFFPHVQRITPAYAGKSRWHCQLKILCQDHPRLCGEKVKYTILLLFCKGSPPPMRGKVLVHMLPLHYHGITPAYAGKRLYHRGEFLIIEDHPRLCGEKLCPVSEPCRRMGSPPPMRGKATCPQFLEKRIRITPAYAGKSPPASQTFQTS